MSLIGLNLKIIKLVIMANFSEILLNLYPMFKNLIIMKVKKTIFRLYCCYYCYLWVFSIIKIDFKKKKLNFHCFLIVFIINFIALKKNY